MIFKRQYEKNDEGNGKHRMYIMRVSRLHTAHEIAHE